MRLREVLCFLGRFRRSWVVRELEADRTLLSVLASVRSRVSLLERNHLKIH